MDFFQLGFAFQTSQNRTTIWEARVRIHEDVGDILHLSHSTWHLGSALRASTAHVSVPLRPVLCQHYTSDPSCLVIDCLVIVTSYGWMGPSELTQGLQTAAGLKSWSLTLPELPHTLYVDISPQVSPADYRPYPLLSLCLTRGTALHVRTQNRSPVGLHNDLHCSGLCSLLSWKCFRKGQNMYISNLKPPVHTFLSQSPPGRNVDRSTNTGCKPSVLAERIFGRLFAQAAPSSPGSPLSLQLL